MAPRQITTQTATIDGIETEYIFNIPNKHTVGFLEIKGAKFTGASWGVMLRAGNSGVFRSTADHYRHLFTGSTTGVFSVVELGLWLNTETTGQAEDINVEIWNLNTAAPIIVAGQGGPPGNLEWRNFGMIPDATAYSQIRLVGFTTGEVTLQSGGTIVLTTWKRTNEVFTYVAGGETQNDFTGLSQYSAVAIASHDLVLSGADNTQWQVSTDGAVFDSGASDYLTHNSATQAAAAAMGISQNSRTAQSMAGLFTNLNQPAPTQLVWYTEYQATTHIQMAGARDAAQAEEALRLDVVGAANMASGTMYAVGYKI